MKYTLPSFAVPSRRRSILATSIAAVMGMIASAQAQSVYWDPNTDGNSTIGGTGTWNLSNLFWDPVGTDLLADNIAWPNTNTAVGIFGGTSGVVTLNNAGATMTANGLTFNSNGYLLSSNAAGDTLTLAGTTPTITVTNSGDAARINSVLVGSAGLTIAGNGRLTLAGANPGLTGQITISSGSYLGLLNAGALGASGTGNETIVQSGGTLDIGAQTVNNAPAPATPGEEIRIAGTGVNGIGAIVNSSGGGTNTLAKVTLTADATINAGAAVPSSYNAAGALVNNTGNAGRIDIRVATAASAGQKQLDLAGFTLTKTGANLLAIVNVDVSNGNIVVNEGQLNFESGTILQGTGSVTVNQNGKLGFWSISAAGNITRPLFVNGGTIGDPTSTGASQTINSPITILGSLNPNFVAQANTTTLAGLITEDAGSTITEFSKRGGATLALSNAGNSFDAIPVVYSGTLQANYAAFTGGVAPAAPTALTGTPLGTASSITLAGGTLNIRVDGAGDATNQVFTIGKTITIDRAPSAINLDRASGAGTDKNFAVGVTFAPSSASNYYSIGQNQLTGAQGNGYRTQFTSIAMNNDTVLTTGDFTFNGDVASANRNSLIHTGNNTWGFIGGTTQEFNALFNIGSAGLRVGSMYGTGVSNTTVTAGTGQIYSGPNNGMTFRSPTNIANGQLIELVSQRITQTSINLEGFTSLPTGLRATGSGVLGLGSSTFSTLDLSRLGDGTFRVGANFIATNNGTVTGAITPGAGNVARFGAGGTVTISGTDALSGAASLEVGSDLINGGFRTHLANANQTGTVVLSGTNSYTGGTTVNRSSVLFTRAIGALGTGPVDIFGTLTLDQTVGTLTSNGTANDGTVRLFAGSVLNFDDSTVTGTTPNRYGDTSAFGLNSTTLTFTAKNVAVSDTIEAVGAASYAGGSVINLSRNSNHSGVTGHNVQLTADSLTRVGTGTIEFVRTTGTGAGYGTGQKFIVTNSAPVPVNGMISPSIVAQNNTQSDFLTYAANGIAPVTYDNTITTGTYTAAALNYNGTTGGKVAVTTAALTLQDNPTLYALRTNQSVNSNGANNAIAIRSGGLISDATSGTITIAPSVTFNNGTSNIEGLVYSRSGGTLAMNVITGNGLTKFGAGTLNLGTDNATTLSGTVSVNQGNLTVFGTATSNANFSPAGAGVILLNGGQVNIRTANAAGTTFSVSNNGSFNLLNGISIASNVPIATLDVNRSGADTTSGGTFTFNPSVSGTGLQLQGSAGTQGQTLNLSGGNYGVTFGNNAVNSFTGNTTLNTAVNLTLNNNPNLLGTAPVLTKSGAGTLDIGVAGGTPTVSAGAKVVLNAGTLQIRSINTFGATAQATLELNAGTLNLRRDGDSIFGATAGYGVIVNGNTAISADRASSTTNSTHTLGKLTLKNNAVLSLSTGQGYALDFTGADLQGNGFVNVTGATINTVNSGARLQGTIAGGSLIKQGGSFLHLMGANNTYDGGTYVQSGILRARATNTLGTGTVTVNPGAILDLNSNTNLGASQKLVLRSNSAFPTMVSMNVTGATHPTGANVDASGATTGIVGLSNGGTVYNDAIDLGALYGGRWSLGGVPNGSYDPRYTAATLGAGADNLYRLGGGGTSMFISISDTNGTARNNLLTGANSVRLGFDSGNILPITSSNFQYIVAGSQDFTGSTVIHRGMVTRLTSAPIAGKSGLSSGSVDVFGSLYLSSASTLQSGGTATNTLTLHPGSMLQLDNNTSNLLANMTASNLADRVADTQALSLGGALIDYVGANNATSTETLGDSTYTGAARIRVARAGTGSTTLTFNSLAESGSKGNQLLIQTSTGATLGGVDKVIITNNAPAVVNNMVDPQIVNSTDSTFVTYGGVNGFANVTYDKTLNANYTFGSLLATDKVDVGTAALNLNDNPTIYALRASQSINNSGPFSQMTIRSGGLIAVTNNVTIQPNLVFNDGSQNVEAKILASSSLTLAGTITADGVVKSGNGVLNINMPQPNYNSGWVVNSGDLSFNDPQAAGQSVAGNGIKLIATQTTGGVNAQNLNAPRVIFTRDNGTAELVTFTGGPVTVVNDATIRIAAGDNRNLQIPAVIIDSTSNESRAAVTFDVPNNRFRAIIPSLTLLDNTLVRVYDGATIDYGRSVSLAVDSLVGVNKNLDKIGVRTLELTGDNTGTFTGGKITVSQGTLRLRHNGALGSGTTTTIERMAALEIATSNFTPAGGATIVQQPGSVERWNVEDARGTGNYNLPAGVNLQLNTNLVSATPRIIGLNGGSLEGFLHTDHVATANQRTVGSAVTINLLSDSFVGQNILQGQGYDTGRGPNVGQPFGDTIAGSYLRIDGNITGNFNLTKTGLDTVMIAGTANTYGNTIVEMGTLRTGAENALPSGKALTTRNGGTFDLFGFNQTVSGLGTDNAGVNPGGTAVNVAGRIINSAPNDNILTVDGADNYTYNGTIERSIALQKMGSGTLTLGGANTYLGATFIDAGKLLVNGSLTGSITTVDTGGTLGGSGSVSTLILAGGTLAPGNSPGILTAGDTNLGGGTFAVEIFGPTVGSNYDQLNVVGGVHFSLDTALSLNLGAYDPVDDGSLSFIVLNNDGSDSIIHDGYFTFNGNPLNEGALFLADTQLFSITYAGGTNSNDIVLTAIPEPGAAAALLTGLATLAGLRRRRRA